MNNDYKDIRDRIPEPPKWWDENAVPRYCDFAPSEVANIYATEVALVEIACQSCGTHFLVALALDRAWWLTDQYTALKAQGMTDDEWLNGKGASLSKQPLADLIQDHTVGYGDPPNTGCCAAGATMTSDLIRVCEYWRRDQSFDWQRDKSLEIQLDSHLREIVHPVDPLTKGLYEHPRCR